MAGVLRRALDGLGPAVASLAGKLLPGFVGGLVIELDRTDTLLSPPVDPAGNPTVGTPAVVFDLASTPYPGWLGQSAGITTPAALPVEDQRAYVRARQASRRGTPGAIRAAAQSQLTGSKYVNLRERQGSPWNLVVQTVASEAPNPAAVIASVIAVKPVGITITFDFLTGATYRHMRDVHGPTYASWRARFGTYLTARDHQENDESGANPTTGLFPATFTSGFDSVGEDATAPPTPPGDYSSAYTAAY